MNNLETTVDTLKVDAATEEINQDTVTSAEAKVSVTIVGEAADLPKVDTVKNLERNGDTLTVNAATNELTEATVTSDKAKGQFDSITREVSKDYTDNDVKTQVESVTGIIDEPTPDLLNIEETEDQSFKLAKEESKHTVNKEDKTKTKRQQKEDRKKTKATKEAGNIQISAEEAIINTFSNVETQEETVIDSKEMPEGYRVNILETTADTVTVDAATEELKEETVPRTEAKVVIEIREHTTVLTEQDRDNNLERQHDILTVDPATEELTESTVTSVTAKGQFESITREVSEDHTDNAFETQIESVTGRIEEPTENVLNIEEIQDQSFKLVTEESKHTETKEDKAKSKRQQRKDRKKIKTTKEAGNVQISAEEATINTLSNVETQAETVIDSTERSERDKVSNLERRADTVTVDVAIEELIEDTDTSAEAKVADQIVDQNTELPTHNRGKNLERIVDTLRVDAATQEINDDIVTSGEAKVAFEIVEKTTDLPKQDTVKHVERNRGTLTVDTATDELTEDTVISDTAKGQFDSITIDVEPHVESVTRTIQKPTQDMLNIEETEDQSFKLAKEKSEHTVTTEDKTKTKRKQKKDRNKTKATKEAGNIQISAEEAMISNVGKQAEIVIDSTNLNTLNVDHATEELPEVLKEEAVPRTEAKVATEIHDQTTVLPKHDRINNLERKVDTLTVGVATEELKEEAVPRT